MKLNKIIVINMLVTLGFLSSCNGGSSKTNQLSSNSLTPSATKPQKSLVIKNGEPVRIPEINALVPLIKIDLGRHHYHLCTGVVVAPNKILTAAHCLIKLHNKASNQHFESKDLYEKISIIFPKRLYQAININLNKPERYWNVYPNIKGIYARSDVFAGVNISDGFFTINDYQKINDLAIIELGIALKYKFHMKIASVAPQVNEEQIVVGFGYNTGNNAKAKDQSNGYAGRLRMGKTIVSESTTAEYPSILRIGGAISNINAPYVYACEGDSGGPSLSYNENSLTYTITGIASLSYGSHECSSLPNAYMNVAYYKDWIESGYKTDSLQIVSIIRY
jgi:V8-like Glu-specific endopeptidase